MLIRLLLILTFLSGATGAGASGVDSPVHPMPIPIYDPSGSRTLLSTRVTLSAGTARVSRSDRPKFSAGIECKSVYFLTGALYLSGGSGVSLMRSQTRPLTGDRQEQRVFLAYAPAGIGFSIGDDRATIITAVDVLPGVYFHDGSVPDFNRRFTYGIAPEFGFLFRCGRHSSRGIALGMTGKVRFMQSADARDGGSIRYNYGGMGLMLQF